MTNAAPAPPSTLAPLRVVDYRRLLGGTFVSAVGLFLHAVAASWVMLELTGSPFMVGLVTASTFIPRLFAGIPAGALADIVDRRWILIWANIVSAVLALVLAWLQHSSSLTPALLVVISLALGLSGAVNLPAFQATVPDLVPRALVANAVSLQSGTFNVARVAGPAIGGVLVGAGRSDLAFAINGVSYLFVSGAALTLRGAFRAEDPVPVRQAMLTGLRFVRHTGLILRVVVLTCLFALTSASVQTLLPNVAQDALGLGARGYGGLYACFGGGALLGALLLERVRQLISERRVIPLAIGGFGAVGVAFGFVRLPLISGALLAVLGVFWVWTLATLNATVQLSAPRWVRGRAMGIYLLAFTGFYPMGSLAAGAVAEIIGAAPSVALFCAPAVLVGLAARHTGLPALSDIVEPSLVDDPAKKPHGKVAVAGGPVVVATEWEIDPIDTPEFFAIMRQLRTHRLRTGAFRWDLFRDVEHPNRVTEVFEVVDWEEHLRQHERMTDDLVAVLERARSFDRTGDPDTRHLVGIDLGNPGRRARLRGVGHVMVLAVAGAVLAGCALQGGPRGATTETVTGAPPLVAPQVGSPDGAPPLTLEPVTADLDFPLFLASPPGDERLFIVERAGRIRIFSGGSLLPEPFLDISDLTRPDGERGLLGLAFHPDYSRTGRLFVHYSGVEDGDTRLVEYRVSADRDRAEENRARMLLTVEQPASNHNGGTVTFGPDGYLYLALGDGGGSGDRFNNAQNPETLLGSLLRLDVDRPGEGGRAYAIPPDNPFADGVHDGVRGAPEVWAYGLRNPWRVAFDHEAGLVYVADVGQNAWEEINVAPADAPGLNYGWPIFEGNRCFRPRQGCSRQGLVLPVLTYEAGDSHCGVIGGYVYRGERLPTLRGTYFYGELCGGWVRSFRYEPGRGATDERDYSHRFGELGRIVSFGQDAAGELYVISAGGSVNRIAAG